MSQHSECLENLRLRLNFVGVWNDFADVGYKLTLQKAVTSGRRAAAIPCSSICEQS